jgi:hypothetical protein
LNLGIRRFWAVLKNTGPKFKNIIPLKHEQYCLRDSCGMNHAKFEWNRM